MTNPKRALQSPGDGQRALIENFPNGVLVLFDAELQYQIVGPAVLPFSKIAAVDMIGRSIEELFPPGTVDELEPELLATIEGETRSFDIEYEDRIHHIETKPAEIDGEAYGVLVTQGVTEERETAEELRRQNERLDQFSSMVSHDLRNPLATAVGRLDLYRETDDEAHLDAVETALYRIQDIVEDITTIARYGRPDDEMESVSLADVAEDAWRMTDTRSAQLTTQDGTIEGYVSHLQGLFENLFRNAIGHGGDAVTVRVGPLSNGFFVEDTGIGIPAENRGKVFDHGFSTGYGGGGTGLTIVSRIADLHGYEVSITEGPEGGARFEFRNPGSA